MSRRCGRPRFPAKEASKLDRLPPPGLVVEALELDGETLIVFEFPANAAAPGPLTEAEQEVTALVLQGLTTAQIAAARGVARATVSSQLQSIYRKLGVTSRAELACKLD